MMHLKRIWLAAAACLALCACAHTVKPATRDQKNLGTVAAAPLKDLGVVRPEAPRALSDITYPYDGARLANGCAQIAYEIGSLDGLLGPEFYSAPTSGAAKTGQFAAGVAESAATGLIPFRGVVRTVTGANKAQAEVEHAIEMGILRRAFLRGYGVAAGCAGMVPPAPAPAPK